MAGEITGNVTEAVEDPIAPSTDPIRVEENVIEDEVTYATLITCAAESLYNLLSESSVAAGTFRNNIVSVTIGTGGTYGTAASGKVTHEQTVTLTETENRSEDYTVPELEVIMQDMCIFLNDLGFPVDNTIPTSDGALSFFFALNFFVEKAIIKRAVTAEEGSEVTYHLHYQAPSSSDYTKIPFNYALGTTITQEKISNIYNQVKSTSLLSDNARATNLSSAAHTSSSSSSSCSSSAFIAYFNLD